MSTCLWCGEPLHGENEYTHPACSKRSEGAECAQCKGGQRSRYAYPCVKCHRKVCMSHAGGRSDDGLVCMRCKRQGKFARKRFQGRSKSAKRARQQRNYNQQQEQEL
jgi:hypothetical protein